MKQDCKCSNPTDAVVIVRKYDCSELKRCEPCFGDRESTNNDHYTYAASLSLAGCRDPARINTGELKWALRALRSQHRTLASISLHQRAEQAVSRKASSWEGKPGFQEMSVLCFVLACLPQCGNSIRIFWRGSERVMLTGKWRSEEKSMIFVKVTVKELLTSSGNGENVNN